MASRGHGDATLSLAARSIANATPTARGRCEAMVDVCGMIARSWRPNTLWRPPEIGSLVAATTPARMSATPSRPAPGQVEGAAAIVQQGRVGRPRRHGHDGVALVARRPDRVVPLALRAQPTGGEVAVPAGELHVVQPSQVDRALSGRRSGSVASPRSWERVRSAQRLDELALERRPRRVARSPVARRGSGQLAGGPRGEASGADSWRLDQVLRRARACSRCDGWWGSHHSVGTSRVRGVILREYLPP